MCKISEIRILPALLGLTLIMVAIPLSGQSIENVRNDMSRNKVVITFDIVSNDDSAEYAIKVYPSFDGGKSFRKNLKAVKGDLWGVKRGADKSIIWNLNEESIEREGVVTLQLRAYKILKINYRGKILAITEARSSIAGQPITNIQFGNDKDKLVIFFDILCNDDAAEYNLSLVPVTGNENWASGVLRAVDGDSRNVNCGKNKVIIWRYQEENMVFQSDQGIHIKDSLTDLRNGFDEAPIERADKGERSDDINEIIIELAAFENCYQDTTGNTYTVVDEMPGFEGGINGLRSMVQRKVLYPDEAAQSGIQGTVLVDFVVTEEGKVENVCLLKGVHPLVDSEAIKVIENLPYFTPGKKDGKAVRVKFTIPIIFQLF